MPAYDGNLFHPPAPLARVVLRNPQNKETIPGVALLIDSGADVTLIPQSALTQVGISLAAAETYELQIFDRHISRAHSVILELVFLNRTFRGKFLVIDQECGILGRDILNDVSVVLDGPNLTWRELL
jgi:Retroviral aspartyl protease